MQHIAMIVILSLNHVSITLTLAMATLYLLLNYAMVNLFRSQSVREHFDCSVIVIDSYNGVVYTVEVIVSKNQTNWMFRALSDLSPVESFYYLQNSFQLIPYR